MSLEQLLEHIENNQAKIEAFGKFDDAILKKINYKFRLDWNYYSNRMEGGTLTRSETRSVMVGNIVIDGKPLKDVMEMNGHDKVVLEVLGLGRAERRLSEKRIKEIHKAIMHEDDPVKAKEIGQWKKEANEIINYKSEKIEFVPPVDVPERMHKLLSDTNTGLDGFFQNKKNRTHPLFVASDFHLDYVSIHPFYDGNGRTARIFTNLILIACGFPVIIIKDEHKDRYYRCLADIQAYGGSPALFYAFIAERIIESQAIILSALNGEDIEEVDDLDKRIALLKNSIITEDKVKEKKNIESLYRAISEVAFPLFEQIEAKCMGLRDLFMDYDKDMNFTSERNGTNFQIGNKESKLATLKQNWLDSQFHSRDLDLRQLGFEFTLRGFKKSIHGQILSTRLVFWFDEYNYTILTTNDTRDKGIKKAYSDKVSISEQKEIIKKALNPILDQIESYSKSE